MMEKEKFVFLTGLKPVTVISGSINQAKSGSDDTCCKRYKKGKHKCKDCPEDKHAKSGLKF